MRDPEEHVVTVVQGVLVVEIEEVRERVGEAHEEIVSEEEEE